MTDEQLITYFNEHVLYELLMIRYAQRRLTPAQTPILWNALFATFNVSARNLYDFLTNGGKGGNSVNVKDYIKYCASFQLPSITKITGTLQKLNPQVFHMSKDRTMAVNEKITRERVAAVGDGWRRASQLWFKASSRHSVVEFYLHVRIPLPSRPVTYQ